MHFRAKFVKFGAFKFRAAIGIPLFNMPEWHIPFVIGEEEVENDEHLVGCGSFAKVDGNVFSGRIIKDVHINVAERG